MGFAAYVRHSENESDITPVVGASELKKLWIPIISEEGLDILDRCITGGLPITDEYHQ